MEGRIYFEVKNKATASYFVEPGKIAWRAGIEEHYVISTTPVDLQGVIYPLILGIMQICVHYIIKATFVVQILLKYGHMGISVTEGMSFSAPSDFK